MPPVVYNDFDPVRVSLQGSNLIEASAGTGKTYSIAILTLRFILQLGYRVDQILMVTYTKDAAAEMELRVRDFMRDALQIALGNEADMDKNIVEIVKSVPDHALVIERLRAALAQYDKAAVYTIHGFCSRILNEFAFESGSAFRSENMSPDVYNLLFEDAFNQAWREKITVRSELDIRLLITYNHTRKKLLNLVKGALNGKQLFLPDGSDDDFRRIPEKHDEILDTQQAIRDVIEERMDMWAANAANMKGRGVHYLKAALNSRDEDDLYKKITTSYDKEYIRLNIDQDVIELAKRLVRLKQELENLVAVMFTSLAIESAEYVQQRLMRIRSEQGKITFDDMILELHRAICEDEGGALLAEKIRHKYKAVFIDEFQDTDRQQYEIFSTIFQNSGIAGTYPLFYIGDPKQSIYAFRKADLQTYFRASEEVDYVHRMNQNFRSSAAYIDAMNAFFIPEPDFDVFDSPKMRYHPVSAPKERPRNGGLYYNEQSLAPLRLMYCANAEAIYGSVVDLVLRLLADDKFKIGNDEQHNRVRAGQIGILVRNNKDGQKLKALFSDKKIPAVTVSDSKVFESEEAQELVYILKAAAEISRGNIHRALLTKIAGFEWQELLFLQEDELLQQFREYQEVWEHKGIYVFLRQFVRDVQVVKRQLSGQMTNADRRMSNLFQLMEMLHSAEQDKNYHATELITWLSKGIAGEFSGENEYLQRIESDEQAVKIVTIHSSKGLEYDVVIAPFLEMKPYDGDTVTFFNECGYFTADKHFIDPVLDSLAGKQELQEQMRLLYVAVTRARYHAYIFSHTNADINSPLQRLLQPLFAANTPLNCIRLILSAEKVPDYLLNYVNIEPAPPELSQDVILRIQEDMELPGKFAELPELKIPDKHWEKTSYSSLSPRHEHLLRATTDLKEGAYDQFVFQQIRKGAQSGNMLHDLFERIDFTDDRYWPRVIQNAINRYPGTGVKEEHEAMMRQLLFEVTQTILPDIAGGFSLDQVSFQKRLSELEFDLPLSDIDLDAFPEMMEGRIPMRIHRGRSLTGILNGKIDLFFEHNGCYYLLDWKSNHLGNRPEDYHAAALAETMEAHNYYLQYYFYSLALYRYLRLRIPGFDYSQQFGGVYYLFVRGMRKGTDYGIYYHKPALNDLSSLETLLLAGAKY
ncbi:MAG: UvrD-helicase domain-containing protein [Bacteroidota bacterium]